MDVARISNRKGIVRKGKVRYLCSTVKDDQKIRCFAFLQSHIFFVYETTLSSIILSVVAYLVSNAHQILYIKLLGSAARYLLSSQIRHTWIG